MTCRASAYVPSMTARSGARAWRATLVTLFEADVFPGRLSITSRDPDPTTTAYGMMADFIAIARSGEHPGDALPAQS